MTISNKTIVLPLVIFCFLPLFFELQLFAQNTSSNIEFLKGKFENDKEGFKVAVNELHRGDSLYNSNLYTKALYHYLKANDFNPNNALLNMKIGHCYLNSSQKLSSLQYLEKAVQFNADVDVLVHFLLGKAYHLNMEWDKAINEYEIYINQTGRKDANRIKFARKGIEECKVGKELARTPFNVKIENLGSIVNSKYPDYFPLISADESLMIFTSRRNNTTGGRKDEGYDFQYHEDVYITYNKGGKWKMGKSNQPWEKNQHQI